MVLENQVQNGVIVSVITDTEASLQNSEQFRDEMTRVINEGHKHIILSFERVTYVDSSFLGSMVSALKLAITKGAEIYLVNMRDDIYDLLALIRMNKVFKIFRTAEQVIENIR